MLKYLLLSTAILLTPAMAQPQQQDQQTPPEVALQMNSIIGTWAQTLMQQAKVIDELQKQNTSMKNKIKELELKSSPKKGD